MERISAPDVIGIFAEPQTREHVTQMYEIGLRQQQESGFAVYEGNVVSELVTPTIPEHGEDYSDAINSACGVDLTPVTNIKGAKSEELNSRANITQTMVNLFNDEPSSLSELDDRTAAKVRGVMSDFDIDQDMKTLIIEKILKKAQPVKVDVPRNDILMVSHNHPQLQQFPTHIRDLMLPSVEDLEIHTQIRAHSKSVVDLIVAPALRGMHKGLLLASSDTSSANLAHYNRGINGTVQTDRSLGELSLAGFVYAEVDLTKTGRVAQTSVAKVRAFERELNERAALTIR